MPSHRDAWSILSWRDCFSIRGSIVSVRISLLRLRDSVHVVFTIADLLVRD